MARPARIVAPGVAHHIAQRGNNRQDVFFVDDDQRVYLAMLKEQCDKHRVDVLAYCLMTNHVRTIGVPRDENSLAIAIGRSNFLYAQYVNRMHGRSGHLWQNRFESCLLDQPHLRNALIYVERNPVRAKIVRHAWDYPWSSAAAHVGGQDPSGNPSGLLDLRAWRTSHDENDWRERLQRREDDDLLADIRLTTQRGRLLATDKFISKLESTLGRRLRPLPGGRPKKK